jgi:site-specific DNA-methyltransferase (adenine-specific)
MVEQHLLLGDSKDVLKTIKDGSIDLLATDPPYSIGFMGKDWDKTLPDKEIWRECYRVLKPGAFIAVMSSPRSDVLYRMIKDLEDAGFDMSFSPILWTYHTGFPKASDTSKMIDKRLGVEREVVGRKEGERYKYDFTSPFRDDAPGLGSGDAGSITAPATDLAKKYEGSKLGFQPKPAVEHIIIGMKPHGSKSYIDNVLNFEALPNNIKMTYPFIQVPKPAKKEKDFGLTTEAKEGRIGATYSANQDSSKMGGNPDKPTLAKKNFHPTTKPVKLMSYIITLFTREGDFVLDPFLGSGTTGIASKLMGRSFVGIEREQEYMDIAKERCEIDRDELIKFFKK